MATAQRYSLFDVSRIGRILSSIVGPGKVKGYPTPFIFFLPRASPILLSFHTQRQRWTSAVSSWPLQKHSNKAPEALPSNHERSNDMVAALNEQPDKYRCNENK